MALISQVPKYIFKSKYVSSVSPWKGDDLALGWRKCKWSYENEWQKRKLLCLDVKAG